jgi:hypothetical protein
MVEQESVSIHGGYSQEAVADSRQGVNLQLGAFREVLELVTYLTRRPEVLAAVKMSVVVCWVVTPRGLAGGNQCSSETCKTRRRHNPKTTFDS